MDLNNRGQAYFVALALAIVIIILALALAVPTKSFIDSARANNTDTSQGLDCSNSSINNFDKANCVATDIFLPYFIGFLIFLGGAIIGGKLLLSQ